MSSKSATWIEKALRYIVEEALKSKVLSGKKGPEILETEAGKEFVNAKVKSLCAEKEIHLHSAQGTNKARMAERAIHSLKRVVMASVESGRWLPKTSWNDKIKLACLGLNRQYSLVLGMSLQEGKQHYWRSEATTKKEFPEIPFPRVVGKQSASLTRDGLCVETCWVR